MSLDMNCEMADAMGLTSPISFSAYRSMQQTIPQYALCTIAITLKRHREQQKTSRTATTTNEAINYHRRHHDRDFLHNVLGHDGAEACGGYCLQMMPQRDSHDTIPCNENTEREAGQS